MNKNQQQNHHFHERRERFQKFVTWFSEYIKGDEKGEGQIFLNEFLKSFGNAGIKEIGAELEERVKKKSSGTVGFCDLVWRPRMILELKCRGENLAKHYNQAFEYWVSLVPNRPRYMVLCNFDEFWIYDLNIQLGDPVHKLKTKNLPADWGAFGFLFPKEEEPIFNNNNIEVTKDAANLMGQVFNSLKNRNVNPKEARRFILQLVVALFAQDVEMIPKYTLHKILKKAVFDPITQEEIKKLFDAMATPPHREKPKNYKDIAYFNGGLFNEINPIELSFKELNLLYQASKENWARVRPSIFGAIFESSMNQNERHAKGVHFTSELDILKIVGPTILDPFKERVLDAKTKKELIQILKELGDLKVLDPACGSGNFLYVAYRECVRLAMEIENLIYENFKVVEKFNPRNLKISRINPKNFYGLDINSFGVELAKVALSIGRKLSSDEFHLEDSGLPFDNLDSNIICADALFTPWPDTDVIIGNPPFLGGKRFRQEYNDEYIEKIYKRWPEVKGQVDFCCFWFRLAHVSKAKRIGLVGTNSITQNVSRMASLDYIVNNGGYIHDAVSSQKWSGEAMVHVSIVNWMREIPSRYFLNGKKVEIINSSLQTGFDITRAKRIKENLKQSFKGCTLHGKDFIISEETAKDWIKQNKKNTKILKTMISGVQLVNPNKELDWVIDFFDMPLEEASLYKLPFEHVKKFVKPVREKNRRKIYKDYWWHFGEKRIGMREKMKNLKGYFCTSTVSKYVIFRFIDISILPNASTIVITSDDFYILGILNSKFHSDWGHHQGSTLGETKSYISSTCFETFPFPQNASELQKQKIRNVMTELENFRNNECLRRKISLTAFYNEFFLEPTSNLYQLHCDLDRAVCDAYGWKYQATKNYNEELFRLNLKLRS